MAITVSRVTAFKLTLGDRVGALAEVLAAARNAGIDFRSVAAIAVEGQGVIVGVPADLPAARPAAVGAPYSIAEIDVFWVEGDDERGALCEVADKLAAAGVSIQASHASVVGDRFSAVFYVASEDADRAAEALGV